KSEKLEEAVKERDGKIDELQAKQQKIQKLLDLLPPGFIDELEEKERERRRQESLLKRKGKGGGAR
ncbi:MAG: hypothetical protein J5625_08885, partial [Lachnospiraceae bacterium]|nr:hypothetical protein [Lachnospiraceae bacterium]